MENTIIEKIKNACAQSQAITISHDYFPGQGGSYGYEVKDNGEITRTLYNLIGLKNCGCFGCDSVIDSGESELIGNCNDLSFLG